MTADERLRRAIHDRTSSVEPRPGGLARIEEKLMTEPTETTDRASRTGVTLAVAGLAAVVLIVVGFFALRGDDDPDPLDVAGDPTTTTTSEPETTDTTGPDEGTTEAPTTTTEPEPTTTETAPPPETPVDPATVLYPDPLTTQRFEGDPASAARAFATEVVGMQDPLVGDFMEGDSRSGEVEIRPMENGPVTTVMVRRMEDDTWFVIGTATDDLRLEEPANFSEVGDPIRVTGEGRAFEGTIQVRVLADQSGLVGEDFVTGGGGEIAPFEGDVDVDLPDGAAHGIVVLFTEGGEDFLPWTFTAVRVSFAA